jgi:hypothetical protein
MLWAPWEPWLPPPPPPLAKASPVQANVPAAIARAATEAVRMDFMVMFVSELFLASVHRRR